MWPRIITAISIVFLFIGLTGCGADKSNETGVPDSDSKNEQSTETKPSDPYADLNDFIERFNSESDIKIISTEEIDIHDESTEHYRTEFRLNAYDNALAYTLVFDDGSSADLVDTANVFGKTENGSISRVYVLASFKDSFESIFRKCSLVMHPDIINEDIDEALDKIMHPYKFEEMEYLISSGSGIIGGNSYTYSINEKDSCFEFSME